jgi:RNA ligase
MKLTDLLPERLLAAMIAQNYVTVRVHPTEPLAIYNYTAAASYDNVWNDVTLACRGLIVNHQTGEVVARPLAKFFTWGQPQCPRIHSDAVVHVADKLGILYPAAGRWSIATRGSFLSDQAQHATRTLRSGKYMDFVPRYGYTYLFEIVYPANRIVVDYGDTDDLVLLGVVDTNTGDFFPATDDFRSQALGWPGPTAQSFGEMTFAQALAMPPRDGAEGIVVLRLATGDMVKIKQDDYIALHRILTNITARTLWEHLAVNDVHGSIMDFRKTAARLHMDPVRVEQVLAVGADWQKVFIADALPDEFHTWVQDTINRLSGDILWSNERVWSEFNAVLRDVGGDDRKAFAAAVAQHPDRSFLFALYNGHDIRPELWRRAYPSPEKPFAQSEEVA